MAWRAYGIFANTVQHVHRLGVEGTTELENCLINCDETNLYENNHKMNERDVGGCCIWIGASGVRCWLSKYLHFELIETSAPYRLCVDTCLHHFIPSSNKPIKAPWKENVNGVTALRCRSVVKFIEIYKCKKWQFNRDVAFDSTTNYTILNKRFNGSRRHFNAIDLTAHTRTIPHQPMHFVNRTVNKWLLSRHHTGANSIENQSIARAQHKCCSFRV